MGTHTIQLNSRENKEEAIRLTRLAPPETYVRFKRNKRTIDQNSRLWALLTLVSMAMRYDPKNGWHVGLEGERYSPEDWKDYFCHSLSRSRWMPDENGGMIPLGLRTSEMDKQEHSDLTALIEEFASRHGLELKEPNRSNAA